VPARPAGRSPAAGRLRPEDKVSIVVHTSNPDITRLFNLVYAPTRLGASDYTQGLSGYTLDAEGNIDFPVLGKIHLGGMRREEAPAKSPSAAAGHTVTGNQKNFAISSSLRCCGWSGSPAR